MSGSPGTGWGERILLGLGTAMRGKNSRSRMGVNIAKVLRAGARARLRGVTVSRLLAGVVLALLSSSAVAQTATTGVPRTIRVVMDGN
jgi:hypothetical protein